MYEGDIPEPTQVEKELYKWQVENRILPKVGFRNAKEVKLALEHNNCHKA